MIVYYDTEFIEQGPSLPIELISIGMVREDGATLYLINADVSLSKLVRHPWLSMNVVPQLPIKMSGFASGMLSGIIEWDTEHGDFHSVVAADTIAHMVREFVLLKHDELDDPVKPELWAYYGAYDHVVLSQLYGSMADLPQGMPMYTNDIMQEWTRLDRPAILPPQPEHQHRAIDDAYWCSQAHTELRDWRTWLQQSDGTLYEDEMDEVERYKAWKTERDS
jgi:hypothetical protein